MARATGLSAQTLRDALKGIPSGRRRRAIIETLLIGPETGQSKRHERNVINLNVDKIPDTSQSDDPSL